MMGAVNTGKYRMREIVGSTYDEKHEQYWERLECGHDGHIQGTDSDGATHRRCYACHPANQSDGGSSEAASSGAKD